MINLSDITRSVEKILQDNLTGEYTIERGRARNTDQNLAATKNGWIGIRRGSVRYSPHTTVNWHAEVETIVEYQYASLLDTDEAEETHEEGVKAIMDVLTANKTLGGYVHMTIGYDIEYQDNSETKGYWNAAIITVRSEVKTSL